MALGEVREATKHIHLQWFAGEEASGDAAGADQSKGGTPADKAGDSRGDASASGGGGKTSEADGKPVSAEEFSRVKADYERILGVFKEKEAKEKRQRDEALTKKGEFEKLYGEAHQELETLRPRLERLSAVVQTMLEAELQGLPKGFDQSLLPAGDPEQKLDWLVKAKKANLFAQPSTQETPRKPGDGTPPQRGAASVGFMSIYEKTQR